jgi:hypothetical protein
MSKRGTKRTDEIELDPKGWARFEQAVDAAVKSGPKHKPVKAVASPRRKPK